MAGVARPRLCENGDRAMSKKPRGPSTAIETAKVPAPVRAKLKRVNCEQATPMDRPASGGNDRRMPSTVNGLCYSAGTSDTNKRRHP